MIYALPYQSLDHIKTDIEIIKELDVEHISYYSLILEEHTVLNNMVNQGKITLPEEDLVGDMSDLINVELTKLGYSKYEISNYSKPGYESRHNLLYWNCEEYIGVGMRANGYLNSYRYQNQHTLNGYLHKGYKETKEFIDIEEQMKEYFLLGLRKTKGVSYSEFINRFNINPFDKFNLKKWIDKGLLEFKDDYICFTKVGIDLGNIVFEEFV